MSPFTKFIKFVNLHKKEILFFSLIYLVLSKKYHFKIPSSQDFVFDDDFNFEKTKAMGLAAELVAKGYIEETK